MWMARVKSVSIIVDPMGGLEQCFFKSDLAFDGGPRPGGLFVISAPLPNVTGKPTHWPCAHDCHPGSQRAAFYTIRHRKATVQNFW
ncbi:hypothetical protein BJV74DRAFT_513630 [Russula compacta]|nr:hypothetical protein BJV74DRAFT_513630 [Russula compacta]